MTSNHLHPRTQLVHAGTRRSQYGEMSEAIFLTQGFAYESAEAAEARFIEAGPDEFIYARYGNPTVAMFEERIAALEGAEDAFATASGMAAVNGALFSQLQAGDLVIVTTGETIPIDGVIDAGLALVDQQTLTGEASPLEKTAGEKAAS